MMQKWIRGLYFNGVLLQVILSPDADPPVLRIMDYKYESNHFILFYFEFNAMFGLFVNNRLIADC